jgi:hypothetical protein
MRCVIPPPFDPVYKHVLAAFGKRKGILRGCMRDQFKEGWKMRLATWFLVLAVALCLCTNARGQAVSNSRVDGAVSDSSGASVPGAQVQITNTETGIVRTIVSGADGSYTIPDLQPGTYTLQVKKEGFSTYDQTGIVLDVGSTPTVDVVLQVGSTSQTVEVTAVSTAVETHSNSVGQLVDHQEILDLPLNGRDPMQLILLTPATTNGGGGYNGVYDFPEPTTVAFAGTNPGEATYYYDGGNGNDAHSNGPYPLPFPDALEEFKVDSSSVPAEYGMHAAGSINAITKSGSNQFHGDLFEFVRNYIFDARNYFTTVALGRDELKRNQFGGVIGGPIKKDKIFFFAAFQDQIQRDSSAPTSFVPTAAMLTGDFSAFASLACNPSGAKTLKVPSTTLVPVPPYQFVGNMINPLAFSAPSVKLAGLLPTTTDPCGKIQYVQQNDPDEQWVVGKVDFHINDKSSIFVRYFLARYNLPFDTANFLTLNQSSQFDKYQDAEVGWTYLISNTMVNSIHTGVNRALATKASPPGVVTAGDLGVPGYWPLAKYINLGVTGGFSVKYGTGVTPVYFNNTDFQASDDLEITKGTHQLGIGVDFVHFNDDSLSPIFVDGEFSFTGGVTGLGMSDFFLGDIATFEQSNYIAGHNRKNYIGIYAQDSWQVRKKLTLNYGLRWEPMIPGYSHDGYGLNFNEAAFSAGTVSKTFPGAPPGLSYPTKDYPGLGTDYLARWLHFEPRIGISFDPRGKGREVIRASYGYFYDFEALQYWQQAVQSPPYGDALILTNVNFTNPYGPCPASSGQTCGTIVNGQNNGYVYAGKTGIDPFPISPSGYVFGTQGAYMSGQELNMKTPNLQQWNVSVEKQFAQSWSVTLTYLGNKGTHNWINSDFNPTEWINPSNDGSNGNTTIEAADDCTFIAAVAKCPLSSSARRVTNVLYTAAHPTVALNAANNANLGTYFSTITEADDNGTSSFNGGVLTVNKRVSHNFSIVENYTYSKCLDTGEPGAITAADGYRGNLTKAPFSPEGEVGPCAYDHRHQLTITAVFRSPHYSGLEKGIISDWQVSPIIGYQSGDWDTVQSGSDTALLNLGATTGQRACYIGGGPTYVPKVETIGTTYTVSDLNTAVWAAPSNVACTPANFTGNIINTGNGPITVGPLGNVSRGTIYGSPSHQFDLALSRDFKFKERNTIDFRFEVFNVPNHANFGDPTTATNSGNFGKITSAGTPRQMQFALKYLF